MQKKLSWISIVLVCSSFVAMCNAQNSWHLSVSLSAWPNNCDIPAGGRDSKTAASFGPSFMVSHGKFRLGATFYTGHFDIDPHHAIILDENGEPVFEDEEARKRGFTSFGWTDRTDLDINAGYDFNRYARLSVSLVMNRHSADLQTYWFPIRDATGDIVLPSDPSRVRILDYKETQLWFGENFSGSIPVETVSARFSIFYNTSLLVLLSETGKAFYEEPVGTLNETSPRLTYRDENGNILFPPRDLGTRSFGGNVGITFSTGAGFQLIDSPVVVVFGGYNLKFFGEEQTALIDHSVFKGPFAGVSVNIF